MVHEAIKFEEGWSYLQKGITRLIRHLEGEPEQALNAQHCMELYNTAFHMCTQKPDYSQQLYDKYREVIEDYTMQTVLPSLREKHDEYMLRELVKRWNNHKLMVRQLAIIFRYLDRYFFPRKRINSSLREVGLIYFHDLIYHEMHSPATQAVIALIHKEREGEQIDRELVRNVIDVFIENGMGSIKKYEEDFESFMLQDTASYYTRKASRWMEEDSCPDYTPKAYL
ncbi:unnamed protein product [Arabidopsis halleri]